MKNLLFLVLWFVSGQVLAADYYWVLDQNGTQHPDPTTACSSAPWASWFGAGYQFDRIILTQTDGVGPASYRCIGKSPSGSDSNPGWNAIRMGNGCTPPKVFDPATGSCTQPKQCPAAGSSHFAGTETYSNAMNLNQCIDGCGYTASGGIKAGGKNIIFGPMIATGSACANGSDGYGADKDPGDRCSYRNAAGKCEAACKTGQVYKQVPTGAYACVTTSNTPPDTSTPDKTCPRGYLNISQDPANPNCAPTGDLGNASNNGPANCPAGQHSTNNGPNGASYCVYDAPDSSKPPTTTTKNPETTTTNPDGSTTKTSSQSWNNSDGSISTKTTSTTTDANGKVTTSESTLTGKDKLGNDGRSDGGADDKNDFCKQNPGLNVCKNSTVVDACGNFSCDGDAVQCSILRQASERNCADNAAVASVTNSAPYTLGGKVLNGTDGAVDPFSSPTVVAAGSFDSSDLLGGRSCPADTVVTLMDGQTFEISYGPICDFAAIMRPILIACAMFAALLLVVGVF